MSEHDEQVALIKWFDLQFNDLKGRLVATPNGGMRDLKVAKKLKAVSLKNQGVENYQKINKIG